MISIARVCKSFSPDNRIHTTRGGGSTRDTAEDTWLILIVVFILAGGIALTFWTAGQEDARLRQDLLTKTRIMERGIRPGLVERLTGTEADLQSPDYLVLKDQLMQIRSADHLVRFTYLMGRRPDGTVVFLVDSEPPDSPDYSQPGQEYPEASDVLVAAFASGREATEGPVTDRWGTWVSGLVPLTRPGTGNLTAVFGMDIDATDWNTRILLGCIPVVVGTLLMVLILLIFIDIRRRDRREKQILAASEHALRESERRLSDLISFLPDATFAIDLGGRVIAWNKAMEELTGVAAGEMLGKGNYEYALPFYGVRRKILIDLIFEPDDVIAKDYSHIIRHKGVLIADTALPRPKGRTTTLMGKAVPLYDHEGKIVGAIEAIRDITERKAAEEKLARSEERYRLLLQNVNDGIIVSGISRAGFGKIVDVNDRICRMLGYNREELLSLSIGDIDVPEQTAKIPGIIRGLLVQKHALFTTEYFRKDRTRVPVEINVQLFEIEGRPLALSVIRDITERKRVEEETARHTAELQQYADALRLMNSKLTLLNSITRHDILNQVTVITGYLDLIQKKTTDPALRGYIAAGLLAAANITDYIRFSREYQEIGGRSPRWFKVRDLVASAAAGLTLAPVTLSVDLDNVEVFADPLLEKVFYTLLENSLRHGGNGLTSVSITCRQQDKSLEIVYADDGVGVLPAYKEKIFDRRYYRHTGYGLVLSREILAITGISIREDGGPGKGARFGITVPEGKFRYGSP